jgi:triphosphoribosyl-dephospho-CoA synthetase
MTIETETRAITDLQHWLTALHERNLEDLGLAQLGDLHRVLRAAVTEVEEALAPKIVNGAGRGMTYVELASAAGYGSVTTITKIMRKQGASPGRGNNPPRW